MTFFLAGGFPMVFIVVFGAVALAGAGRFALWPERGRVGAVVAYSAAVGLAGIAGTLFDLTAVTRAVAEHPELRESGDLATILVVGSGEALSPAILAAGVLSVVALLAAVGLRRLTPD